MEPGCLSAYFSLSFVSPVTSVGPEGEKVLFSQGPLKWLMWRAQKLALCSCHSPVRSFRENMGWCTENKNRRTKSHVFSSIFWCTFWCHFLNDICEPSVAMESCVYQQETPQAVSPWWPVSVCPLQLCHWCLQQQSPVSTESWGVVLYFTCTDVQFLLKQCVSFVRPPCVHHSLDFLKSRVCIPVLLSVSSLTSSFLLQQLKRTPSPLVIHPSDIVL